MNDLTNRIKKHYLPCFAIAAISCLALSGVFKYRDLITFTAQTTGYISFVFLAFSLIMGPYNLLSKKRNPVSTYLRRDISISGGFLAVVHSATGLFVHLRGKTLQYFLTLNDNGYHIRLDRFGFANYTGLFSALIIILLLVTSNDYFMGKLNSGRWKNFQRLAYPMFILATIHSLLYRIGTDHVNLIYSFYLPLISIVLIFQMVGIWLNNKMDKQNRIVKNK